MQYFIDTAWRHWRCGLGYAYLPGRKGEISSAIRVFGIMDITLEIKSRKDSAELPRIDKFLALNETHMHLMELKHEGLIEDRRGMQPLLYAIR